MDANLPGAIQQRRAELGLSMSAAARLAEVHRLTWRAWEKGDSTPEDYNYVKIEKAMEWQPGSVAALIQGRPPETRRALPDPIAQIVMASEEELDGYQRLFAKWRGPEEGERFRAWADGVRMGHSAEPDSVTDRPREHDPR